MFPAAEARKQKSIATIQYASFLQIIFST